MDNVFPINNLLNLSGKVAIITGGAKGIGLGIAYRLAEARVSVVIADLNKEEADKAAAEIAAKGWKAKGIAADVSSEEDVQRLVGEAVSDFGSVDILVNNAGIYPNIPVSKMTLGECDSARRDFNTRRGEAAKKYAGSTRSGYVFLHDR